MLIVDKKTTEAISVKLGNKMDNILQNREVNKQKIVDCLTKEIEALDLKIENYDLYYRNSKERPKKEVLYKEVSELTRKKQEVLRY